MIPIVFITGIDPIQVGLVSSLSHPGGNLTGFNLIAGPLPTKQLGLLHELVPAAKTVGVLINPNKANAERDAATVQDAARALYKERYRGNGNGHATAHAARPDWLGKCIKGAKGQGPLPNLANVMVALRESPSLQRAFAYDEMLRTTMLMQDKGKQIEPRPVQDTDIYRLQEYVQRAGLKNVAAEVVHAAADLRGRECAFHPVLDYLNALKWDGSPRLETWLARYLGAKPTAYTKGIGRPSTSGENG